MSTELRSPHSEPTAGPPASMSDRLQRTFDRLRERDEKAMGLFLTDGFPEPDATVPLLRALDEHGTDFLELGMPFSDPLAEGGPIQRSSNRALAHGITLDHTLETARRFRSESETPLLLMGYLNPLLRYGIDRFARNASEAGVDGLILADLPLDEADEIEEAARRHDIDLVYLVAPNTSDERVRAIDRRATGFVYAVSVTGVTGSDIDTGPIGRYLRRIDELVTENSVMVGFGIRSHEDAMALSRYTDGFIVGSALVRRIETLWEDEALTFNERISEVGEFAHQLKYGSD